MTRRPIRSKDSQNPERILNNIINDYVGGRLGGVDQTILKVAILKIDNVGGQLAGPGTPREDEPPNPRGSFVGRIVSNAADTHSADDELLVYWPMFPHHVEPIKESEHAYVIFEDQEQTHGLWLCRISEPKNIGNLNLTPGTKRFVEDPENDFSSVTAEQEVQDLDGDPGVAKIDPTFQVEEDSVFEFNQRVGDRVLHGSNNTTIIMSRDRVNTKESGNTEKAGAIDIVAGRTGEDIDLENDAARLLVSMSTSGDENFSIEGEALTDTDRGGNPSYVLGKADQIRLVARKGMKIVVESGPTSIIVDADGKMSIETSKSIDMKAPEVTIETEKDIVLDAGEKTKIGSGDATEKLVKGDKLKTFLTEVIVDILAQSPVDVAGIPGIGIINSAVGSALSAKFATFDLNVLSSDNLVED